MNTKKIIASILLGISMISLLGGCGSSKEEIKEPAQQEMSLEKDEVVDGLIEDERVDINKTYSICHNFAQEELINPLEEDGIQASYKLTEDSGVIIIQVTIPGLVDDLLSSENMNGWDGIVKSYQRLSKNLQSIIDNDTKINVATGICIMNDTNEKNMILGVGNGKIVYNVADEM